MELDNSYGIDIYIGPTGDFLVWPNGAMAACYGPDNAVQALTARIRTAPGEVPLHPDFGSEFTESGSIIGGKMSVEAIQAIARNELRQIVESDARFVAAKDIEVTEYALASGHAARVKVVLYLAQGESIQVTDFVTGTIDSVTPGEDDLARDTLISADGYFALDDDEDEDFRDLVEAEEAAFDISPTSTES